MLDQSFLRPEMTPEEVAQGCLGIVGLGLASVCVRPCDVALASSVLAEGATKVGTVVGFPHGGHTLATKVYEAAHALEQGAAELDMVINIGALRGGDNGLVEQEVAEVVRVAEGRIVKVILETAYLTDEQKVRGCTLAEAAGATFVKTSTGFAATGATIHDVRLMRSVVGDRLGVKASGGVKTLNVALDMIEAGATRIGTSSSLSLLNEL